jgi:hypothetical protein
MYVGIHTGAFSYLLLYIRFTVQRVLNLLIVVGIQGPSCTSTVIMYLYSRESPYTYISLFYVQYIRTLHNFLTVELVLGYKTRFVPTTCEINMTIQNVKGVIKIF